jgi:hypothetical protein
MMRYLILIIHIYDLLLVVVDIIVAIVYEKLYSHFFHPVNNVHFLIIAFNHKKQDLSIHSICFPLSSFFTSLIT